MQPQNKISVLEAMLMNMNIMIGAAIFIGPSMMAAKGGSLSFLGWPAVAILFFPVVWSIVQLTKYFPDATSFFSYSKHLGVTTSFITGWVYFLGYLTTVTIQTIGLSEVLKTQFNLTFVTTHPYFFYLIVICALAFLNFWSLKLVAKIQNAVTIFKLLPIVLVIVLIPFFWNSNFQIDLSNISVVKYTIPFALFGYWGFESCTNLVSSIKGGRQSAIKAILGSFFIVAIIYTIFHFGLIHIMGSENLAAQGVPAFIYYLGIKSKFLFNLSNAFISSVIALAYFSSSFGIFIANSSMVQHLAKENFLLFSSKFAKTNRFDRPVTGIIVKSIIIYLLMVAINNKMILTSICNTGILAAFLINLISLFVIQFKKKDFGISQIGITTLALVASGIAATYNWFNLGNTNYLRFQYLLPLIALTIFGLIMFKLEGKRIQKQLLKAKDISPKP
ncbi:MAG: APC family permease [bacterium]